MGGDDLPALSSAALATDAPAVVEAYLSAVVPAGLGRDDAARAREGATVFLDVLLRHLRGDPAAIGAMEAMLRDVAAEVVRAGDDPGVLLDRFDAGRHVILDALLRSDAPAAAISDSDDRLRRAQRCVRAAIRDAVAAHEQIVDDAAGEVVAAIEAGEPSEEVMRVAAEGLARLVECDRVRVWMAAGAGRVELVASAGSTPAMAFFASSERGMLADILKGGVPVRHCPVDPDEWEEAVPGLPAPGSVLFVPLATAGSSVGLVYALRSDPQPFSDAAERLAVRFVRRVEPALAWAMQLRSLQRWADASQDFLRITTHELRRPLTVLRGYLEMLDSVPAEQSAVLRERMSRAAEQLAELLTGISDTVTLEDPARQLTVSHTTVGALVDAVLRGARDEADQHGVRLVVDVESDDCEVYCDVDNVVHALANLISNAINHTSGEHRVWFQAAPEGPRLVRFVVRDEGSGIHPGDESKVFLKYFRSDPTRRAGIPGSGLGLYFVRLVAERHGGRVAAENSAEGGACFSFELPLEPGVVAWSL